MRTTRTSAHHLRSRPAKKEAMAKRNEEDEAFESITGARRV